MNLKTVLPVLSCLCLVSLCGCVRSHINTVKLSSQDEAMVGRILEKLNPLIAERRQKEDLPALAFEQLYTPLDKKERMFLRVFQDMDTQSLHITIPYQGIPRHAPKLVVIRGQKICLSPNDCNELPPVFLPKDVYEAYSALAKNMKKDIGKTLYVESGYRSAAYQLYLFLFYLKNHNYSVKETARFVAWPGYSEHGWPQHQAIDFVNEQGIDGQNRPAEFEALEEYRWLLNNASQYGFEVSYPKGSTMAFEPWHWRYKGKQNFLVQLHKRKVVHYEAGEIKIYPTGMILPRGGQRPHLSCEILDHRCLPHSRIDSFTYSCGCGVETTSYCNGV